jgi:surface antigen
MAAHHFVLAGAEWCGVAHPQDHKHTRDAGLLAQAAAPQTVDDAWHTLEVLRPGRVYGAQGYGESSKKARESLQAIKEWAEAARPS